MRCLQLRFDLSSTAVRLLFDNYRRVLYAVRPTISAVAAVAAVRPLIINQFRFTSVIIIIIIIFHGYQKGQKPIELDAMKQQNGRGNGKKKSKSKKKLKI